MRLTHRKIRCAPHLRIEAAEVSGLAPDSQQHVKYCFCSMNTLYVHVSNPDVSVIDV